MDIYKYLQITSKTLVFLYVESYWESIFPVNRYGIEKAVSGIFSESHVSGFFNYTNFILEYLLLN